MGRVALSQNVGSLAKRPKNCMNKDVDTRKLVGEDTSLGIVTIDIKHREIIEINNDFETMTFYFIITFILTKTQFLNFKTFIVSGIALLIVFFLSYNVLYLQNNVNLSFKNREQKERGQMLTFLVGGGFIDHRIVGRGAGVSTHGVMASSNMEQKTL